MDKCGYAEAVLDVSVVCFGPLRVASSWDDHSHLIHEGMMHAAIKWGAKLFYSSYEYCVHWLIHVVLKKHPQRHDLNRKVIVLVPDWYDEVLNLAKFEARIKGSLSELCTYCIALMQWMWRCSPHKESARLGILSQVADDVEETFFRLRSKAKNAHLGYFRYFPESANAAMARQAQSNLIADYNSIELEMPPVIDTLEESESGGWRYVRSTRGF